MHELAQSAAEQQAVRDYWTPERIARMAVGDPGSGGPPENGPDGASVAPGTAFTGMRLARCWGTPLRDRGSAEFPASPDEWGVGCDMGGGASGGPRIALLNRELGLGTVVGVNVHGGYLDASGNRCPTPNPGAQPRPGCSRHLTGPQFTAKITGRLYARASAR
ncbi:hypothetical protein M8C13_22195 [Crossiella sp. SN42]|uniref:hypothetical protein n=1 Tax=Crossiella sp. SN42 TaxID=2944808 RepID=UPI00207CF8D3|nr:hypothetical protein [Crossiella sp. SN42]MCO1578467.1 hypothetical protein [Crossiella sp. SN42]